MAGSTTILKGLKVVLGHKGLSLLIAGVPFITANTLRGPDYCHNDCASQAPAREAWHQPRAFLEVADDEARTAHPHEQKLIACIYYMMII